MPSLWFALAILLAPARPVASPLPGPSPEYVFQARLATNGESYLAAWNASDATHFARIDETGRVEGEGTIVYGGGTSFDVVDLAASGHGYLLLRRDALSLKLYALDPDTLTVTSEGLSRFNSSLTALAGNGTTVLLMDNSGVAQLLDGSGKTVVDNIAFNDGLTGGVGAAAIGGSYLVAWIATDRIFTNVIGPGGSLHRSPSLLVTVDATNSTFGRDGVASNGTNALIAWRSGTDVNAALLSADGVVLSGPTLIAANVYSDPPHVVWNGREYLVGFEMRELPGNDANVVLQRIDSSGQLRGGLETVASGPRLETEPAVRSTPRSTLVLWRQFSGCYAAGYGSESARLVDPAYSAPFVVSQGTASQQTPAVGSAGGSTLTAWTERQDVRRLRLSLLPAGTPVEVKLTGEAHDVAGIGTDGTSYLAAVPEYDAASCSASMTVVPVSGAGAVGEVRKIAADVATGFRPALAWNGSEYVVVWQAASVPMLVGMRVARDGTPLDAAPRPLTAAYPNPIYTTYSMPFAGIVWTGSEYLLAWTFTRSSYIPLYPDPPPTLERRIRRLGRDLTPLTEEIRFPAPNVYGTALAWNGSEALLLWRNLDDHPDGTGGAIWATRLAADGSVLAERRLADGPPSSPPPSLVWSGRDWVAGVGRTLLRIAPDLTLVTSPENLGSDVGSTSVAARGDELTVVYDRGSASPRVFVRSDVPARRRIAP